MKFPVLFQQVRYSIEVYTLEIVGKPKWPLPAKCTLIIFKKKPNILYMPDLLSHQKLEWKKKRKTKRITNNKTK